MAHSVTCPQCKRTYACKPELAGKRAKCKCGAKIQFPPPAEEVLTELDLLQDASEIALQSRPKSRVEALELPHDPYSLAEPPEFAPPASSSADSADGKCTHCGEPLSPGAVICVHCRHQSAQRQGGEYPGHQEPAQGQTQEGAGPG